MIPPQARRQFILDNTRRQRPPHVLEFELYLADEITPIWRMTEEALEEIGLPPPFWAFAWAGGQALARHILDHPEIVRGRRIIDLATGSGLVAIAAMLAGAKSVLAADIDAFAETAAGLNAAANSVAVSTTGRNLLMEPAPDSDVILVGDLFYEKTVAASALAWLKAAKRPVLIGDPGRTYLPVAELEKVTQYEVQVTRDLEDAEIKTAAVWRLRSPR